MIGEEDQEPDSIVNSVSRDLPPQLSLERPTSDDVQLHVVKQRDRIHQTRDALTRNEVAAMRDATIAPGVGPAAR